PDDFSVFFFYSYVALPNLHSFPTRRSSDLETIPDALAPATVLSLAPIAIAPWALARGAAVASGALPIERAPAAVETEQLAPIAIDRKSTRLNSSHVAISYAVFCLKKKKTTK